MKPLLIFLLFVSLAGSGLIHVRAEVVISELLASNDNGLQDEDGDTSDWIEIHNATSSAVSLAGWRLTDDPDNPAKWTFPATNLPPGGFLVVFASGKNRIVPGFPLLPVSASRRMANPWH